MLCKKNSRPPCIFAFITLCVTTSSIFVGAEKSPKIVIVGAGAAGMAAATELVQNNFDVTVLEASGRIGGRIHTQKFGNVIIDLGAQWVNGEVGNPVWEMAAPLGLLEHQNKSFTTYQFYTSDGQSLDIDSARDLTERIRLLWMDGVVNEKNETFGVLAKREIDQYFAKHPNLGHKKEFEHWLEEMIMNFSIVDNWYDIIPNEIEWGYEGDWSMNWKDKGYSILFDIMTKKYPDPTQEIPVMQKVEFRKEVSKIDYSDENDQVQIYLKNGQILEADDVILTPSLGYLKSNFMTMFDPPLPAEKIHVIKHLGFGDSTKILLLFDRPWWNQNNETSAMNILWSAEDMEKKKNDPKREWQNHFLGFYKPEHRHNVLLMWVNGQGARDVERLPKDELMKQVMELLQYIKEDKNVEPPIKMIRTMWNSNKYILGTCSFRGTEAWKNNVRMDVLQKAIPTDNPRVWFAGEATDPRASGSVSGAVNSGRREAKKIIEKYGKSKV